MRGLAADGSGELQRRAAGAAASGQGGRPYGLGLEDVRALYELPAEAVQWIGSSLSVPSSFSSARPVPISYGSRSLGGSDQSGA
jgi:hypothetical protein